MKNETVIQYSRRKAKNKDEVPASHYVGNRRVKDRAKEFICCWMVIKLTKWTKTPLLFTAITLGRTNFFRTAVCLKMKIIIILHTLSRISNCFIFRRQYLKKSQIK